jgi:hypothetical protein
VRGLTYLPAALRLIHCGSRSPVSTVKRSETPKDSMVRGFTYLPAALRLLLAASPLEC